MSMNKLIDQILDYRNLYQACEKVRKNGGGAGVDEKNITDTLQYFQEHGEDIIESIRRRKYVPKPVKRVEIPKPNGGVRKLGALWKDLIYVSDKQYFWYYDNQKRLCLDMNQGVAMIDLRPYASRRIRPVGIGTPNVQDASYPYLIQANYRAGYFTHYTGEGTIASCKVYYNDEVVDLCLNRLKPKY